MSRFSAFSIHFGISLLIFAVLSAIILLVWYPGYFFEVDGGWEGLRIIIGVDLVLGPLLTLIVYKAGKPGLKTDLTLIALFQVVCLAGGMYVVWSERPLALVYVDGHFYSMSADAYREAGVPVPDLDGFPGSYPKRVAVNLPDDVNELSQLRGDAFRSGGSMRVLTELYVPFDDSQLIVADAYPLENIRQRDIEYGKIADWQAQHSGAMEDYVFFPLGTRYKYMFIGYQREPLKYAGLLYTPGPL